MGGSVDYLKERAWLEQRPKAADDQKLRTSDWKRVGGGILRTKPNYVTWKWREAKKTRA